MKAMDGPGMSTLERVLLWVPALGSVLFGLFPFVLGGRFGAVLGYPGNDSFLYRLAGAATFGYAVALVSGIRRGEWEALRLVVIATLTFNLASIYACVTEIGRGTTNPVLYLIFATSLGIIAITGALLYRHAGAPRPAQDLSTWSIRLFALGVVLSGTFGLLGLLVPVQAAQLFGFQGTDVFLYRQAGAASLGYGVMAVFGLRSRVVREVRLPVVMAIVFNGLSFIASVVALLAGDPILFVIVIGAASLFITVTSLLSLRAGGRAMLATGVSGIANNRTL